MSPVRSRPRCLAARERLLGALVAALLLACGRSPGASEPTGADPGRPPEVEVTIGIHRIRAEVADDEARRTRGLSGRERLPEGRGMLFPFDPPAQPAFWMPDMHFDIDIVWIRQGRIVDLTERVPHKVEPPLPRYRPREPVDWVLEVPAGTVHRLGWQVGDPVSARPTPRYRPEAG